LLPGLFCGGMHPFWRSRPLVVRRPMKPESRRLIATVFGACALLGSTAGAVAAPVKGTVVLPQELKTGRHLRGYWRIENGIVPATAGPSRTETVVVLTGLKGTAPPARTVTIDIAGYAPQPPLVVVGEGSVVELKNSDRVPHDFSIPEVTSVMPMERLAPGALRRTKFSTSGGYAIRDAEYPHLVISVIVVGTPFYAAVDDKGGFRVPDAPDGRATLKVWSGGKWIHEQEIEIGPKSADLAVKVADGSGKTPQD
ncbi:MAG TPA: hypothetical protein VGG33_06140, partial [Polyangia bacterium]